MSWAKGRLASFDTETDGPNPEDARIITATILELGGGQDRVDHRWLLQTERPIPAEATAIHGITTEFANTNGQPRREAIEGITAVLASAIWRDLPVIAFNACFDLTVLDRECRRVGVATLSMRLGDRALGPIVDPHVIDKQMDRFRKGKRTLGVTCERYGIELGDAHDSTADALGAARLAFKLAARFEEVGNAALEELHEQQIAWRASQAESLQEYFRRQGKDEVVDPSWPLRLAGAS